MLDPVGDMWLVDLKVIVTINTFYFILYIASATADKSPQSCLPLCDPKDGSLPGSSVRGILQAMVLERAAIALSDFLLCKIAF